MKYLYFKIKDEKLYQKGERYFKYTEFSDRVIQICASYGKTKPGKTNAFGIYRIARMSFLSNYFEYYLEPCTKELFDTKFEEIVNRLKTQNL